MGVDSSAGSPSSTGGETRLIRTCRLTISPASGYQGPQKWMSVLPAQNPDPANILSFKPWLGHNIALRTSHAVRKSAFLVFASTNITSHLTWTVSQTLNCGKVNYISTLYWQSRLTGCKKYIGMWERALILLMGLISSERVCWPISRCEILRTQKLMLLQLRTRTYFF